MRKIAGIIACLGLALGTFAQPALKRNESWKTIYRATPEKINNLVHTKLNVRFDFDKSYLYGKAWITLKPHFYPTDSLRLDAKGMNINEVAIIREGKMSKLKYEYTDSLFLDIKLGRTYKSNEAYTIYIDYTAKPNEFMAQGSAAITDAKGLYFINPKGEIKDKPTQIWTQGETEASSVWFPTIDKTNQKTTQEIFMTVPAKYVTLSNGKLISQVKNTDGTRTDYWKMDQAHSPYLFFMGVGDYAVVKDSYKGKEVNYYVEKEFEKDARKIFGLTPEMMAFYSAKLGVEYPWNKYSQITGRDYVSGAMENTTAVLHQESAQQNARQLIDENKWENTISHELFHHWFGDLVTAESWSNLTINESFANYGELLWLEHKYGKDAGHAHNHSDMQAYLFSGSQNKDLVRFHYRDKEDMFDAVSYNKGGRILHMLRNFVGDDAFFKALNLFLTRHKFKNAEAHELRLAFEEVTGKDLNWFWNQWYFGSGHPKLDIQYSYDKDQKVSVVVVNQTQTGDKVFKLPVYIDFYYGGAKTRHNVWVDSKSDTFRFASIFAPDLVNFDGDKILLAEKKENKTLAEYINQYKYAGNYVDRREAIDFAAKNKDKEEAKRLLINALNDPYHELRERVLKMLKPTDFDVQAITKVEQIAKADAKRINRALAIDILGAMNNETYKQLFIAGTSDSSYSVAGASLEALANIDEAKALSLVPALKKDAKGRLEQAVKKIESLTKGDADFEEMTKEFDETSIQKKVSNYRTYLAYLGNVNNTENFKKGLDKIVALRNMLAGFNPQFKQAINDQISGLINKKKAIRNQDNAAEIDAQIEYINEKLK